MKSIYFGLFLAFVPCFAMNKPDHAQEKMYTIQDSDGRVVELPESVIKEISVLYNSDVYEDDSDFKYHDFSFKDTGLNISGEQLKTLSTCLQNPKKIKNLNAIALNELFEVADCLGVDHSFLRKLTKFAQKHFSDHKHHKLIGNNHFRNSITHLLSQGFFAHDNEQNFLLKKQNAQQEDVYCLDLAHKKLDTLQGIEKVAPLLIDKKITKLKLNNNCFKKADLTQIFSLFPHVKKIKLHDNELVEVNFPLRMPSKIKINVRNNKLKLLTGKLGEENMLSVGGNTITGELQHCLDSIVKPSFYDAHRHQIKSLCSSPSIKEFGKGGLIGLGYGPFILVGGCLLGETFLCLSTKTINWENFRNIYNLKVFLDNKPHVLGFILVAGVWQGLFHYADHYVHGFSAHKAVYGFKPARINYLTPRVLI